MKNFFDVALLNENIISMMQIMNFNRDNVKKNIVLFAQILCPGVPIITNSNRRRDDEVHISITVTTAPAVNSY